MDGKTDVDNKKNSAAWRATGQEYDICVDYPGKAKSLFFKKPSAKTVCETTRKYPIGKTIVFQRHAFSCANLSKKKGRVYSALEDEKDPSLCLYGILSVLSLDRTSTTVEDKRTPVFEGVVFTSQLIRTWQTAILEFACLDFQIKPGHPKTLSIIISPFIIEGGWGESNTPLGKPFQIYKMTQFMILLQNMFKMATDHTMYEKLKKILECNIVIQEEGKDVFLYKSGVILPVYLESYGIYDPTRNIKREIEGLKKVRVGGMVGGFNIPVYDFSYNPEIKESSFNAMLHTLPDNGAYTTYYGEFGFGYFYQWLQKFEFKNIFVVGHGEFMRNVIRAYADFEETQTESYFGENAWRFQIENNRVKLTHGIKKPRDVASMTDEPLCYGRIKVEQLKQTKLEIYNAKAEEAKLLAVKAKTAESVATDEKSMMEKRIAMADARIARENAEKAEKARVQSVESAETTAERIKHEKELDAAYAENARQKKERLKEVNAPYFKAMEEKAAEAMMFEARSARVEKRKTYLSEKGTGESKETDPPTQEEKKGPTLSTVDSSSRQLCKEYSSMEFILMIEKYSSNIFAFASLISELIKTIPVEEDDEKGLRDAIYEATKKFMGEHKDLFENHFLCAMLLHLPYFKHSIDTRLMSKGGIVENFLKRVGPNGRDIVITATNKIYQMAQLRQFQALLIDICVKNANNTYLVGMAIGFRKCHTLLDSLVKLATSFSFDPGDKEIEGFVPFMDYLKNIKVLIKRGAMFSVDNKLQPNNGNQVYFKRFVLDKLNSDPFYKGRLTTDFTMIVDNPFGGTRRIKGTSSSKTSLRRPLVKRATRRASPYKGKRRSKVNRR